MLLPGKGNQTINTELLMTPKNKNKNAAPDTYATSLGISVQKFGFGYLHEKMDNLEPD